MLRHDRLGHTRFAGLDRCGDAGVAFDVGETFAGVDYETGLTVVEVPEPGRGAGVGQGLDGFVAFMAGGRGRA